MAYSIRPGPVSRFWEWLGWKSPHIAAQRVESRELRAGAETKLGETHERAERSRGMSEWLAKRSQENHIVEALNSALDHPRRFT
jgi:hypothetical protein